MSVNNIKMCDVTQQCLFGEFISPETIKRTLVFVPFLSRFGVSEQIFVQGGSNMTGTDLCVNKPHCAAAVRP